MRRTAALIVGGGPAGSAAAIGLAQAGLAAELIERTSGPHDTVCGGFLGWDALAALRRLGLEPATLGAHPIHSLRLVSSDAMVTTRLPKAAAGLSRRTLDEALLGLASVAGALVSRGRTARSAEGRRVRLDDGEQIEAERLLLATGKHELRGAARPVDMAASPVGLRTALRPSPALAQDLEGHIELHLFDGGYAGLLLQEDGAANLCLSVSGERLKRAGGIEPLATTLAAELPGLRGRLEAGEVAGWSAVSGIPYGWRSRHSETGLYRIGDQGAVIASLAGDGIAIALESGMAAAEAIASGLDAEAYRRGFSRRVARPLAVAERLRWAAEHELPRRALMGVLGWAPGLARVAARLTRVG